MILSLIACTSDCLYQQDGCCCLERAVSGGVPERGEQCVNYLPRARRSQDDGQRLSDILHPN